MSYTNTLNWYKVYPPEGEQLAEVTSPTMINVKDFGAKGDKFTNDSLSIQNCFNSLLPGQIALIPLGDFNIDNITFNPPDDCGLICQGNLISIGSGTALTIGDLTKNKRFNIEGLKISRKTVDLLAGSIGIKFVNLTNSILDIRYVNGFETDIMPYGTNSKGNAYNEIHLGKIYNARKSLYLNCDNGGWCNENNFYGGNFDFTSAIADLTGCIAISSVHNATNTINNNRFYSPSLEALNSNAKAFDINGKHNAIIFPRIERIGAGEFTANSQYCSFIAGYGYGSYVIDNGTRNKILGNDKWRITGANGTDAMMEVQNLWGSTYKNYSGLNTVGTETFHVKADGSAFFAGAIKLFQDAYGIFTGTGTPEGVVTASPGSLYLNRSGGASTTLYVKQSGGGNTGWIAK